MSSVAKVCCKSPEERVVWIAELSPQSTATFTVPESGSENRFEATLDESTVRIIGSLGTALNEADE